MQLQNMNKINELLTIAIPVRVDSEERKANLHTVLDFLSGLRCRIIVLEADDKPILETEVWLGNAEYIFVKDTSSVFYRTMYINKILQMSHTEIVAVWDVDVFISYSQLYDALCLIQNGYTMVFPYNGQCFMLTEQISYRMRKKIDMEYLRNKKMEMYFGRKSCGGIHVVHRERYLQCGGENERFTGWGPEDAERLRRVRILGHKVTWCSQSPLYHLHHPRGNNSFFQSEQDAITLRLEFVKICNMTKEELQSYVLSMNNPN